MNQAKKFKINAMQIPEPINTNKKNNSLVFQRLEELD